MKVIFGKLGRWIMALLKELKGSFVGGKISRSLQNRIDLQKFNTWLKEAKNTFIKPEGSVSNRAGTVFVGISKDSTFRLTINVNVSATITINGTTYTGTSAIADIEVGSAYTYEISASGYVPQSNSGTMTGNTTLEITLEPSLEEYTFTIIPTPSDAIVKINGIVQSSYTGNSGETVTWEVSKEGYLTKTGSYVLSEDKTEEIELEEYNSILVTVTSVPTDSLISVNNQIISSGESIEIEKNISVTVSVSKTGHIPYEETFIATENKEIEVYLLPSNINITNIENPHTSGTVEEMNYYKVYNMTVYKSGRYRIELGGAKGRTSNTKGGFIIVEKDFDVNDIIEIWAIGGRYEPYASGYGAPKGWFNGAVSLKVNGAYKATAGGGADANWDQEDNTGIFYSGSGYHYGDFTTTGGSFPSGASIHSGIRTSDGAIVKNRSNVEANGDGQATTANGVTAYGGTSQLHNVLYTLISRGRHSENAYAKIIYIG